MIAVSVYGSWLLVGFVFAVLWVFWLWLGFLFDAIGDYQDAARKARREALFPDRERGN
jgi:hypothetical protein